MDDSLMLNILTENSLLRYMLFVERREWVNDIFIERDLSGEFHTLFSQLLVQPVKFREYFRMTPETFFYILSAIRGRVEKFSNFRICISPEERLAVTLRFLSTGIPYRSLAFSYRIASSTISQIVYETCDSIWECFVRKHIPFPTKESLKLNADLYEELWDFPNCIGAIDGKHVRIKCPNLSGSKFINYKCYFSVVLQGLVDAQYRFISIDVGAYGRQSDSGVFAESNVCHHIENGTFPFPEPRIAPNSDIMLPYVILGDQGYPLKEYLLRPYPTANVYVAKDVETFNKRHSRARKTVECAFGILVSKWRLLKTEIQVNPDHVDKLITTVCLLHNIIIDKEGIEHVVEEQTDPIISTGRHHNRAGREAYNIRDLFKQYFSGPGAIAIE